MIIGRISKDAYLRRMDSFSFVFRKKKWSFLTICLHLMQADNWG